MILNDRDAFEAGLERGEVSSGISIRGKRSTPSGVDV